MIRAENFAREALKRGFSLWTGVPCSYLKPFINYVIDSPELRYVPAVNEGDAVALAAGSTLAGIPAIVMFQNSGLGNAVNPLSSLTYIFKIPVLIITTLRGEPGGPHDEPQHELMGTITTRMLDLLDIRWEYFPTEEDAVAPALDRATRHMKETGLSYGFVMRKDSVAPYTLKERSGVNEASKEAPVAAGMSVVPTGDSAVPAVKRGPMLKAVQHAVRTEDLVLATTGYTGRELYALDDRPNQFYMVGSMGCASSFGLGIALARPDRRVIVLDGDGAVLMRMGALCTIGTERPRNLIHIVFDNGAYESTGGQKTVSRGVDLCAVARACGYERTMEVSDPKELEKALEEHRNDALTFIRVPILSGVPENLPRPEIAPPEVARRFARGFE